MKTFLILGLSAIIAVLAQDQANQSGSELAECGSKFAEKVQALSGTFLDKDEILDLLNQCFDMYYKQGKTLKEINDYYISNYRNVGLDPEQVDTITDVYTKIQDILGGPDVMKTYHQKAQELALEFIKEDQKQVDKTIADLKKANTADAKIELAVCQQVFSLTTAQKKIQLENKLFALLPADKVEPVKEQIRRVGKLLTDSQTN